VSTRAIWTRVRVWALCANVAVLAACPAPGEEPVEPAVSIVASARGLFARYEAAIKNHERVAIAAFYDTDSVVRVINGSTSRTSRAQLDTIYRTRWTPPTFFAWEEMAYDALDSATVLVTGGFRWTTAGSTDTTRYLYAAVLQARDSGMVIRFEHETLRPAER
jgi:hypothetical protein